MVCAVLFGAAGCAVPDSIERRGNFQFEYFSSRTVSKLHGFPGWHL
jgi:hypothetical protein